MLFSSQYASLPASWILLQQLLVCLKFNWGSQVLFCCYKQKKVFLWTMAVAQKTETHGEDEGYIHHFQAETTHKIH